MNSRAAILALHTADCHFPAGRQTEYKFISRRMAWVILGGRSAQRVTGELGAGWNKWGDKQASRVELADSRVLASGAPRSSRSSPSSDSVCRCLHREVLHLAAVSVTRRCFPPPRPKISTVWSHVMARGRAGGQSAQEGKLPL
ncbi:hypothetical protein RRG08_008179 [Elysia crispata]|uniref:Uncharacterized protein n=1 Tax=Elysia crispata TaxID=231223 RepID=A0AAE1A6K4_9GAST|nr:hypothetical protein RRG08_008179 [Elysia crispata]